MIIDGVFFPRDVLDEILDLIESVSEGFPTYSLTKSNPRSNSQQQKRREHTHQLINVHERYA